MDSDIAAKQDYLYRYIIQGGYDGQTFQNYILEKDPNAGIDLNKWTMANLEVVTKQFIQFQEKKNMETSTAHFRSSEGQSPTKLRSHTLMYNVKQQSFVKNIECLKTTPSNFYHSDLKLTFTGYEKKEGGMFQKSYVVYKIKVSFTETVIQRRYSDFQWLREILMVLHPGMPIPPISKKGKMRRHQEKHLYKRMYLLDKFLNKICTIPDIKADPIVQKFMTITGNKQLERQKQKFKKIKNIPLSKVSNLSGNIELVLNDTTSDFAISCQRYLTTTQPQVKKIFKDFKGAATMLENCSAFLKNIGTNCQKLSTNFKKFKKQSSFPQTQQNLFSLIEEMTTKYSQVLSQQAKTFRKQIYSLVKYESYTMLNFLDNLQSLKKMQQSFIDQKSALTKRKEKLWDEGNMAKWGTLEKLTQKPNSKQQAFDFMLAKETQQVLKTRDNYALTNYQFYLQTTRHFRENDTFIYKYFQEIVKMQADIMGRSVIIWANVLKKTSYIVPQ